MSIFSSSFSGTDPEGVSGYKFVQGTGRWHRIREVRLEEEVTLRSLKSRTGLSVVKLKREEKVSTDLTLHRLHWWKRMLDVPIADLLIEPAEELSPLVLQRLQLLKILKTVASIRREADGETLLMAETVERQLLEIVPEMKGVLPWKTTEQQKTLEDLGRIALQIVSPSELINFDP